LPPAKGVPPLSICFIMLSTGFWDGTRNPDDRLRSALEQACTPDGRSFVWFGLFKHDLIKFRCMETTFQSAIIGRDITQECPQTVQSGSYQAPSNVFDSRMVAFVFASILGILCT
jgi:deferrochelatase/peroxidase EfeB